MIASEIGLPSAEAGSICSYQSSAAQKPYITYFQKLSAGRIPERTGNICLAAATGAAQDDMVPFLDVLTGCKTQHLCLVEFPVRMVLYSFDRSVQRREADIPDTFCELVGLAVVLLRINQKPKPFLEPKAVISGRIVQLFFQFPCHGREPHGFCVSMVDWMIMRWHLLSEKHPLLV